MLCAYFTVVKMSIFGVNGNPGLIHVQKKLPEDLGTILIEDFMV